MSLPLLHELWRNLNFLLQFERKYIFEDGWLSKENIVCSNIWSMEKHCSETVGEFDSSISGSRDIFSSLYLTPLMLRILFSLLKFHWKNNFSWGLIWSVFGSMIGQTPARLWEWELSESWKWVCWIWYQWLNGSYPWKFFGFLYFVLFFSLVFCYLFL